MSDIMFTTELKNEISQNSLISLRNLYLPIIGMEAVTLYSIINDYHTLNKSNPTYISINDIASTMRMEPSEVLVAKKKLEAVGLLRVFERADNKHFIFSINTPLSPEAFKKNSILYRAAIKQIGDLVFERVYFNTKENNIKKDDFKEVTVKYHDVFDLPSDNIGNTLEMPMVKFNNKDEAIKGTTPYQFVKYISDVKVSPSQMALFQRLQNSGLSSWSINEIIDYSFEVNGSIVANHIEVIANDMISKAITNPLDIKVEMSNAKSISKSSEGISKSIEKEMTTNEDLSWNDIFDSLGGEI